MEKTLRMLDSFTAHGSDGRTYQVRAYEHLARLDAVPDTQGNWESTGLAEYKLADGRHIDVDGEGVLTIAGTGVRLDRESSH